ncbi:phosphate ABC transporter permease [Thalassotalea insulae]|uniref:Phosphate ABC transporter permease n=1 Tax=Thalassotalea insulae TaxID=2056778 RepID=A0ABQ6GR96_9GAMM|nr:HPr family phosphocarrier protein [Thalassotalea insulae]GLX77932.1 phosphate ABC transporter permease [Thalassotalea insulae]
MTKRLQQSLTISNKLGLHARAATKLAQLSQKFDAKVIIELDNNQAEATSIMGLMLLAGGQGKTVTIITEGQDAEQALADVCQLFTDKFDEGE